MHLFGSFQLCPQDLYIAGELLDSAGEGATITAGLSYMFISLPGLFLSVHTLAPSHSTTILATLLYWLVGSAFLLAMTAIMWCEPTAFYYPAMTVAAAMLSVKAVAVFCHGPRMKQFSMACNVAETSCESSLQVDIMVLKKVEGKI